MSSGDVNAEERISSPDEAAGVGVVGVAPTTMDMDHDKSVPISAEGVKDDNDNNDDNDDNDNNNVGQEQMEEQVKDPNEEPALVEDEVNVEEEKDATESLSSSPSGQVSENRVVESDEVDPNSENLNSNMDEDPNSQQQPEQQTPSTPPPPAATATTTATTSAAVVSSPSPSPSLSFAASYDNANSTDDDDVDLVSCVIHPSTPIPNSDSSLRLLRKFLVKTSPYVPSAYGGNKPTSILSYFFGGGGGSSSNANSQGGGEDSFCHAYKNLVDILVSDAEDSFSYDDDHHNSISDHNNNNNDHQEDTIVETEDNVVIESILGGKGDTMSKARAAMASFCHLLEIMALETQKNRIIQLGNAGLSGAGASWDEYERLLLESSLVSFVEGDGIDKNMGTVDVSGAMIAAALTCAEGLVAHGCLDGVKLGVLVGMGGSETDANAGLEDIDEGKDFTPNDTNNDDLETDDGKELYEYLLATNILCESVYKTFFDSDIVELAALKFLLTMGCRVRNVATPDSNNEEKEQVEQQPQKKVVAMLSGSYLLQAIRICYKLYLSTDSESNKTTAKAALRQIVTSTFKRLESGNGSEALSEDHDVATSQGIEHPDPFSPNTSIPSATSFGPEGFASHEHKDAYLVLRSLCKLSMKAVNLPPSYNSSGYGKAAMARSEASASSTSLSLDHDPLLASVSSSALPPPPRTNEILDPALDSKILALDLILEILSRTKTETLTNAGPQLIYAVRNYLCHSLLKNCTLDHSTVVDLSLRLFVPLIQHFRQHLKTEIEAFVTNVFFVILDSKNSPVEHKLRVVVLFDEICSDPATLAEIFLNYDCDLSAVDLFQRIVNSLARAAKIGLHDQGMNESGGLFVGGVGATRAERMRQDHRALRLEAMRAVRQILASLYASIAPWNADGNGNNGRDEEKVEEVMSPRMSRRNSWNKLPTSSAEEGTTKNENATEDGQSQSRSLVQIYDSKRKRREEFEKAVLKYNQKPSAGIKYAMQVGLLNGEDPADVAQFLLVNKDVLDKTQTGEYLGREPNYQEGFALKVLHNYANQMDFAGLRFDDGIKFYLSGFRLPGEAQKVSSSQFCGCLNLCISSQVILKLCRNNFPN